MAASVKVPGVWPEPALMSWPLPSSGEVNVTSRPVVSMVTGALMVSCVSDSVVAAPRLNWRPPPLKTRPLAGTAAAASMRSVPPLTMTPELADALPVRASVPAARMVSPV